MVLQCILALLLVSLAVNPERTLTINRRTRVQSIHVAPRRNDSLPTTIVNTTALPLFATAEIDYIVVTINNPPTNQISLLVSTETQLAGKKPVVVIVFPSFS
jgi:hypothetical protein